MKGQSSLELFVTIGIVLAFTVPVIFLLISVTSAGYENTAKSQADASARALAETMDFVYSQGSSAPQGSSAQREVLLNMPATTQSISASAGEVVVSIKTTGGTYDAAAPTIANISPVVITKGLSGLMTLDVKDNGGEVVLSEPTSP